MVITQVRGCKHKWQSLCCNIEEQDHLPFICPNCFRWSDMKCFECYIIRKKVDRSESDYSK